jgi:MFS family permease
MSSSLNRFDRYSFYYLIGLSPVIIGFMVWAVATDFKDPTPDTLGWNLFGYVFIAWVLSLIYIVTKMLFSKRVRDALMTKLAGMKERDERESVVAGDAAKFSFLSTLALLIFFFIFTASNVTVRKHPLDSNNKRGSVAIGFGFHAVDEHALVHTVKGDEHEYDYKGIPLTKPVMILLMIFWQVGSYHLIARRELRE